MPERSFLPRPPTCPHGAFSLRQNTPGDMRNGPDTKHLLDAWQEDRAGRDVTPPVVIVHSRKSTTTAMTRASEIYVRTALSMPSVLCRMASICTPFPYRNAALCLVRVLDANIQCEKIVFDGAHSPFLGQLQRADPIAEHSRRTAETFVSDMHYVHTNFERQALGPRWSALSSPSGEFFSSKW